MNFIKELRVLKTAVKFQKCNNFNLIGQLHINGSLHHHVRMQGARQLSTGAVLLQDVVKIEKADYNVYVTNSPGSVNSGASEQLFIPEPPPLPSSSVTEAVLNSGATEATLQSLGLGGWSPTGIVQQLLDLIHSSTGLPWCTSIVIMTLVLRSLMFPLMVKSQKNSILMRNNMPKVNRMKEEINEAKITGDKYEVMKKSIKLAKHMKANNIDPKKQMLPTLIQAPVFISFFLGLRKMANTPVPSFHTGGMLWFPNLTVPDPYYILPLITSATVFFTIKLGANVTSMSKFQGLAKHGVNFVPLILVPICMNFPSAVLCYWVANNFFSLLQVALLRNSAVRNYFNFPKQEEHQDAEANKPKKGFIKEIKDYYNNIVKMKEAHDTERSTAIAFRRAGMGPIPKTYSFDPTKQAHRTYCTLSIYGFHRL